MCVGSLTLQGLGPAPSRGLTTNSRRTDTLGAANVQAVRLPARSPNLNAYAERFVRTIKESCLDLIILVGEASLRRAVSEFAEHYHHERNHQGLGNRLIVPLAEQPNRDGPIACRERLGGLLK
jgi:transposase InsO family protein